MRIPRTVWLTLVVALAILGPFAIVGARVDSAVAAWLPTATAHRWAAAFVLAALLTVDIVAPVPSSLVSTACGAVLGFAAGMLTSFVGMTLGGLVGYRVGRLASTRAQRWVGEREATRLRQFFARYGVWCLVALRPVPVLAEASVLFAGLLRQRPLPVVAALVLGNLGVSTAYAAVGAWGRDHGSFLAAFGTAILLSGAALLLQRHAARRATARKLP